MSDELVMTAEPRKGWALIESGGDVNEIARRVSRDVVRRIPGAVHVPKLRGAMKAFSFHWSNAQAAWDVIAVRSNEFPWGLDGAEFVLFIGPAALSPIGKLWTRTEMMYVAKKLDPHPGYAMSAEAWSGGRRVAARYVGRAAG